MKTIVHFISERIEVPCTIRRGLGRPRKPGYRWTTGYYVCDPGKGQPLGAAKIYPPVCRSEAYALARELFGLNIRVVIDRDDTK